jgi:GT2 family glycosyltransferase
MPDELLWTVGVSYTGMPTATAPIRNVWSASMMVRRDAFTAVGGFSREFAGPEFKAADLALRLVRAGAACLWAPMVTMFALDTEAPAEPQDYWMKPAQRVDAWRFAAKWAAAGAGAETIVP